MATKKQSKGKKTGRFVPMLYDGMPDAIKAIRERKGLSQEQASKRGGVKAYQWSAYETGTKRLGVEEERVIKDGLGVTKTELWREKYRVEEPHYRTSPDEVREETPRYGNPVVVSALQRVWELDAERLPPEDRKEFDDYREATATALTNGMHMADSLEEYHARRATPARKRLDAEGKE